MSTKPIEMLHRYLDAVGSRNVETVLDLFDDEAVVNAPMMPDGAPKSMRGRQAFEPAFRGILGRFAEFSWVYSTLNATDDPDLAVARCGSKAVLLNGRPYTNDYCIFVRLKNDKLIESTEYFDPIRAAGVFAP
jgi:ketosteroid isomerase-like protein